MSAKKTLSIVIPAVNEALGIHDFYVSLRKVLQTLPDYNYEIIIVDDGSRDTTAAEVSKLAQDDSRVRLVCLSRNFGKEIATTAGIHQAVGDATLILDADGQHPVELIPDFVHRWEAGAKVVVGIRMLNQKEGFIKRQGSKLFYSLFNHFASNKLIPGSTDFRLIDKAVQQEFTRMTEHNRIMRGLIDWLGYQRDYIEFTANARIDGEAGYSFKKLFKLAIDSVVSLSVSPLYVTAYIGAFVLPTSLMLGMFMVIDKFLGDPLHLRMTGSAFVSVFILFLIGIMMMSQGIIGLYLSHIHAETQNRPLYIVNAEKSVQLHEV